jgi:hypothetical protein
MSLAERIQQEYEEEKLLREEQLFVQKLSHRLLHSIVEQQSNAKLPSSLHEELFEDLLRSAFSKLPESPLRTSLLRNIHKYAVALYTR